MNKKVQYSQIGITCEYLLSAPNKVSTVGPPYPRAQCTPTPARILNHAYTEPIKPLVGTCRGLKSHF